MRNVLAFGTCMLLFAGVAAAQVQNGDFEYPDPLGTDQPTGWDSFQTSDPSGWDGVIAMGYTAGHPQPNGSAQAYGDATGDGQTSWGSIDQIVENEIKPFPKEIWVGLDMYLADAPGSAWVNINVDQGATHWNSGQLFGSLLAWQNYGFYIPPDYGFICDDLILTVEIQLGQGAGLGVHGVWVDNVYLDDICIPEPATLLVLGLGLPLLRRRRR
jgi:hypothetical protein